MQQLRMPEVNNVIIAGNLTKDPVFRTTSIGTSVINFSIASNHKYRDHDNQWQDDVCYVGIVAWNKLAESCNERLKKGCGVLIDGELQSRSWKTEDGFTRYIVEIKARRIQFLNKRANVDGFDPDGDVHIIEEDSIIYENNPFEDFPEK